MTAYMSQERKKSMEPAIKAILKKYGFKGSLSVRHLSTLVLTIQSGDIDVFKDYGGFRDGENRYIDVNTYHYRSHFTGKTLKFLSEVIAAMKGDEWYDESDIMTDYFNVSWYIAVRFGKWDKPYKCNKELEMA